MMWQVSSMKCRQVQARTGLSAGIVEHSGKEGAQTQNGSLGSRFAFTSAVGTQVPAAPDESGSDLLVVTGADDFLATVETVRGHVMTTVGFTGRLVHAEGRAGESVVGTAHTAA
tara:strand:- start:6441 stop:6782 length:342 start_codon:yes stop_codon:yes gene_type:complete